MRIIVFAGPTLNPAGLAAEPASGIEWRGPAKRGDIYLAARAGPVTIGLIDGYFRDVPSPQHKEILWAIHQGSIVLGAASMGALRAAELHAFGMIGVGRIFEAYAAGRLWRDDEVAVEHGPAELGYPATSEALVNLRYTFANALHKRQLSREMALRCVEIAAGIFYAERTLENVVRIFNRQARSSAISASTLAWLLRNRVDQKAADARKLLQAIGGIANSNQAAPKVTTDFEDTMYFSDFRSQFDNPFLRDIP